MQAIDRPHQRFRQHHPADAPAGHAEIFGERVDDHDVVGHPRCGLGRERIIEAVIDLVGDEPDPLSFRSGDEIAQRLARHHGAGRVGGTCDQHALERRLAMRREQQLGRDRPARRLRRLDHHRLAAERREDMAIGRIARQRDRDAVARLEQREECQDEARRRAGRDDDARRIDRDAIGVAIVPRDARAQRRNAERLGIAEAAGRSAARAAAMAVAGAGAAGCPTSMWMTRPPAASMRAAAAITSITMNAGTSLRTEGAISRLAASNIAFRSLMSRANSAPLSPHFCGHIGSQRSRNQT